MVVTPMMIHQSSVQLPQTGRPGNGEKSRQLSVAIEFDGMVRVDDKLVAQSDLTGLLRGLHAADPDRPVVIAGDRRLRYEQISAVIESIEEAGFQKFGLITVRRAGQG
jgi:biopolymer transport protein TolR